MSRDISHVLVFIGDYDDDIFSKEPYANDVLKLQVKKIVNKQKSFLETHPKMDRVSQLIHHEGKFIQINLDRVIES